MLKNSKKQGDVGVGKAISYFSNLGYTVLFPLSDSQDYDLAIDPGNGKLQTVQVKTGTTFSKNNKPIIGLRTLGGNRSGLGKVKTVKNTNVDLLFCYHLSGVSYLIPIIDLNSKSTITLTEVYSKYKI